MIRAQRHDKHNCNPTHRSETVCVCRLGQTDHRGFKSEKPDQFLGRSYIRRDLIISIIALSESTTFRIRRELVTWGIQGSNPGRGGYLSSWLCIYRAPNCSKAWSVQWAYGTVHYKEPLKSFEIRIGPNSGFGLPSVAILPWLCRKRRKAKFIYSHGRGQQIAVFTISTGK